MYKCNICPKSYTWRDSLTRHIRQSHRQHEATKESDDEMDTDGLDCVKCGAVFNTARSMRTHLARCDDKESDSDSDVSSMGSDEEEDESAWVDMLQEAYDLHDKEFKEKVNELEAKGSPNPRRAASDELLPKYKRSLKKLLHSRLLFNLQIKKSEHYKKLMEDIHYYKDEKGFELSEAVKRAIKRNGSILDEVLDEDSDDESKENDSQSEEDEDNDME